MNESEFEYANQPERTLQSKAGEVIETARRTTQDVVTKGNDIVREQPGVAILSAFLVGAAVGAAIALIDFRSEREKRIEQAASSADRWIDVVGSLLADKFQASAAATQDGVLSAVKTVKENVTNLQKKNCGGCWNFWK